MEERTHRKMKENSTLGKCTPGNIQTRKMEERTHRKMKENATLGKWQKMHNWKYPDTENGRMYTPENDRKFHPRKMAENTHLEISRHGKWKNVYTGK